MRFGTNGRHRLLVLSVIIVLALSSIAIIGSYNIRTTPTPRAIVQPPVFTGPDQVGFDCGVGTTQAVLNATSFPVADGTVGTPTGPVFPNGNSGGGVLTPDTNCRWVGDLGAFAGAPDGTNEPLVADQDETFSTVSPAIGGGFTAGIVIIQNSTSTIDAFDITINFNPNVLHAVEYDTGGLGVWGPGGPFYVVNSIDNSIGQLHLGGAIFGAALPGNFTLFNVRFDVVGVGNSTLTFARVGLGNPSPLFARVINSNLDAESFFDPSHTLKWSSSFAFSPNPEVPHSQLTMTATSTCAGCTGTLNYGWSTNSNGTVVSNTNPAVFASPPPPLVNRVTLNITDGAHHTVLLVQRLPLTNRVVGPTTLPVNTSGTWTGYWLGGISPYTGSTSVPGVPPNWRFCPGTASFANAVCAKPNPVVVPTSPTCTLQPCYTANQTESQILNAGTTGAYHFAGVYTDTLTIIDSPSPVISSTTKTSGAVVSATAAVATFLVNVTGGPRAYTVTVTSSVPSVSVGSPLSFTVNAAYDAGYPSNFQSSSFRYTLLFGDGTSQIVQGGLTATVSHTFNTLGTFTVRVTAKEIGAVAFSQIQETSTTNVAVVNSQTGDFTFTPSSIVTGQSVSFNATVSGGTPPYTFKWDFGDGTTGTGPMVTHTYSSSGSFMVKLTITDAGGANFTSTHTLVVGSQGGSPLLYAGIGGIAAAIVAVLLALFLRRRKSHAKPASSPGTTP
jgi:PKD repeat protein